MLSSIFSVRRQSKLLRSQRGTTSFSYCTLLALLALTSFASLTSLSSSIQTSVGDALVREYQLRAPTERDDGLSPECREGGGTWETHCAPTQVFQNSDFDSSGFGRGGEQ